MTDIYYEPHWLFLFFLQAFWIRSINFSTSEMRKPLGGYFKQRVDNY